MPSSKRLKIALVGNPNSGKSSLFNRLTGLNQKTGNFPGVTVEKRVGNCKMPNGALAQIIDLPGIYSIYPRSLDERIVSESLLNHGPDSLPDIVVVVSDATNLKRGLLLLTQVIDMGLPVVLALNMMDLAARAGLNYDLKLLSRELGIAIVPVDARRGLGIENLKNLLIKPTEFTKKVTYQLPDNARQPVKELMDKLGLDNSYEAYLFLEQPQSLGFLSVESKTIVDVVRHKYSFTPGKFQGAETIQRYAAIQDLLGRATIKQADESWKKNSASLDRVLTHRIYGYAIFFLILLLIFQSIFAWAQIPMDLIDTMFAEMGSWLRASMPSGMLTNLLVEGIIPGIGGIVIFVPQIAILFAFISILEETGYMARVVFLMDKIMRKFGLNGRSVVPLISGVACAIPAIMSTRTIDNWKERIITIFVTPFVSCSARLPVFTILIGLIIPNENLWGFFNLQGLALMGLYLLGFFMAFFSAWLMKLIIKARDRSYLIMELPTYRWPKLSNVGFTIVEKTKAFVFEAGKIILAISIVLWVMASFGPGDRLANAEQRVRAMYRADSLSETEINDKIAAYKLENSYAGVMGKVLEPVVKPLGYDWKIGIALVTSFAAREVFVATMATIYSVGSGSDDESTIKSRMKQEVNPQTGEPRFTPAVGFSLLIFYTFAMQCMSTLAVVYRETKGWKWPLLQLVVMTALAYLSALLVYQTLA